MGFFSRCFGICKTPRVKDGSAWLYADETLTLDLTKIDGLSARGSAVRLEGSDLPDRVLVVQSKDGTWYAFRNRCTHIGRRIDLLAEHDYVQCCSIGRSTWNFDGELLEGPAMSGLTRYEVEHEGTTLRIALPQEAATA